MEVLLILITWLVIPVLAFHFMLSYLNAKRYRIQIVKSNESPSGFLYIPQWKHYRPWWTSYEMVDDEVPFMYIDRSFMTEINAREFIDSIKRMDNKLSNHIYIS